MVCHTFKETTENPSCYSGRIRRARARQKEKESERGEGFTIPKLWGVSLPLRSYSSEGLSAVPEDTRTLYVRTSNLHSEERASERRCWFGNNLYALDGKVEDGVVFVAKAAHNRGS